MHQVRRLKWLKARFTRVTAFTGLLSLTWILAGCSAPSTPSNPGGNGNTAPITTMTAFATIGSSSNFSTPAGILYTNGNLWVADSGNNNLSEWTTTGTNVKTITTFNGGATFDGPWGVNLDSSNNIYVADYINYNVELFSPSGTYITSVNSSVLSGNDPSGIAVNSGGTTLLVLSAIGGMGVFGFPINAGSTPTYGTPATLCTGGPVTTSSFPLGLKLDKSGNIWVADKGGHYLVEFNSSGAFQKAVSFGTNPFSPQDLAFDNSGNMYVADSGGHQLVVFDSTASPVTAITNLNLSTPAGITTDGNGTFYITDYGHKQVVVCH